MSEKQELKMETYGHGHFIRFACWICGEETAKEGFSARILLDGNTVVADDICRECLKAGPEGIVERAKEYSEYLRNKAEACFERARMLSHMSASDWIFEDAFNKANKEWELEAFGGTNIE